VDHSDEIADLAGQLLDSVELSTLVRIKFGDDRKRVLVVEAGMEITDSVATTHCAFLPWHGRFENLDALARLVRDVVESAVVDADGAIRIVFASGSELRVPPTPRFEAWSLYVPGCVWVSPTDVEDPPDSE
jgi:hypothetical protein